MAAQLVVCEFTVTSLDEKFVYEFRVSAQNQVGMSLPCDLEGAVIPKDVLGEDLDHKPPFCLESDFYILSCSCFQSNKKFSKSLVEAEAIFFSVNRGTRS